ncbi:lytic transglycosylase domain-containing protein [Acetobacteraceae bacterium ESL0709]|nr:lytic transglycosylase domain-containing protein [Acetobacteraceae bacterium ESL0709]
MDTGFYRPEREFEASINRKAHMLDMLPMRGSAFIKENSFTGGILPTGVMSPAFLPTASFANSVNIIETAYRPAKKGTSLAGRKHASAITSLGPADHKQIPFNKKEASEKSETGYAPEAKEEKFDPIKFRNDAKLIMGKYPNSVLRMNNNDLNPYLSLDMGGYDNKLVDFPPKSRGKFEIFPLAEHYKDDTGYAHSVFVRGSKLTSGTDEPHQEYLDRYEAWKFARQLKKKFGDSLTTHLLYYGLNDVRHHLPTGYKNEGGKKFKKINITGSYKNFFSDVPVECDTINPYIKAGSKGQLALLYGAPKVPLGKSGYINLERYLLAKAMVESNGKPLADNKKKPKIQGLMQMSPETAEEVNVWNRHDPVESLEGARVYTRLLFRRFRGDTDKEDAAYNTGPTKLEGLISKNSITWKSMVSIETANHKKRIDDAYQHGPIPYVYGGNEDMRDELIRACVP